MPTKGPPPPSPTGTARPPAAHVLRALALPAQARLPTTAAGPRPLAAHVRAALGPAAQAKPVAAAAQGPAPHVQRAVAPTKGPSPVARPVPVRPVVVGAPHPGTEARRTSAAQPKILPGQAPARHAPCHSPNDRLHSRAQPAAVLQRMEAPMEGPWERDEENLKYLIESTSVVDGRFEHQTAASGSVEYHGDADDSEQGWYSFFGKTYHAKTNNHGNTRGKVNPDAATAIKEKWPKMIGHPEQKILYAMEQEILNQKKGFRSVTLHLYSTQGICPACKRALSITRKALRDASILFDVKMYYGHYNPESSYGWKGDPKLSGSFFHYYLN